MDSIIAHFQHFLTTDLGSSLLYSAKWFLISTVLFVPLAMLFPNIPGQKHYRKDMWADSAYWFFGPIFYAPIYFFLLSFLIRHVHNTTLVEFNNRGLAAIRALPIWLQAFIMLLATDFLQYWMHRLFHHEPLWRFHAIHHSPVHIDWLSSARFHPINIILYSTLMNAFVFLLGFSPEAFAMLAIFNGLYSPLVHANLNWTYGPFKYVLSSPVFHRWHHTQPDKGGSKNFAPTFPFIDVMFGTFYMPQGELPSDFGTKHDPVPDDFFGQIAYPFTKRTKVTLSGISALEKQSLKKS